MSGCDEVGTRFTLSELMTVEQLEQLYENIILRQDFYDENYGSEWSLAPYEELAAILQTVLVPRKHVDVGCGKGFLVQAMRRQGADSFGIDFSEALIKRASAEIQGYVRVARTEDWLREPFFQGADLITYMEVFEHLPISISREVLRSLRRSFTGHLFVTTPSFGIDERWKVGIRTNAGTPGWRRDMADNRAFQQIVLHDGLPHHGHITLASYRWWTEFFLFHGWVRSADLETQVAAQFRDTLVRHNWNPYILEPLHFSGSCKMAARVQLSRGWHEPEEIGGTPGRWSDGHGQIFLPAERAGTKTVCVTFCSPDIDVVKDFTLAATLEQQLFTSTSELRWTNLSASYPSEISREPSEQTVRLRMLPVSDRTDNGLERGAVRLTLSSPTFCLSESHLGPDPRKLGLFVREVTLDD